MKPKLTESVKEKICQVLSSVGEGNHYATACAYAGISYRTFRYWMKRGEEEKSGPYRDLYEAVKEAEAQAEAKLVAILNTKAPDDWRAALAMLERRWPEKWGKREKVQIEGETEFIVRWASEGEGPEPEEEREDVIPLE